MSPAAVRQVSVIACLVGLAVSAVYFLATWNGTPTPAWMPMVVALIGGYELVQCSQGLWLKRAGR